MKVWYLLTASHPIVLIEEYTIRVEQGVHHHSHSLRRRQDGSLLCGGKIK
jgi:hypothetical protein